MTTNLSNPGGAIAPPIPSRDALQITAFRCNGLENLAQSVGFPLAVVAAVRDPDSHIRYLDDTWYAGGTSTDRNGRPDPSDFDSSRFREWWKVPIDERCLAGTPHPLSKCIEHGSLLIRLPTSVPARKFSASFQNGLSSLRFETVARRPFHCGKRRNTAQRVAITSRYSRTSADDLTPVEVRDLISFHPQIVPRIADVAFMTLVRLIAMTGVESQECNHHGIS